MAQDRWKMQATTEIVALYGKSTLDIKDFVETDACQDVLAKITSKMLYEQCMNDVVNQLQSQAIYVGSKPLSSILSEDTTLKTIVEKYVEDICKGDDTKFDSDQMEKDVKGIINKYFNYAGLDNLNIKLYDSKEDSTDDNVVASYSGTIQDLNNRELTSLQINVAQAEIYSRVLSEFQQDYLDYYTEFQKYAKAFVNSIIAVVPKGSWENNIPDWDSLAAQFECSTAKINLDSYIDSIKNPTPPEVEEEDLEIRVTTAQKYIIEQLEATIDDEDNYYCDFLISFKGIDGEVLTVLNSKEELETYLNFCYEGDNGVLDLGIIRIDKEYDNCFSQFL